MNDANTAGDFKQWGINRFAYVNGLKQIPNSNPPAFSVSLCEPYGRPGSKQYVYADLIIKELAPYMLLHDRLKQINDENTKVSIQFNCYNLHPSPYVYRDKKGEVMLENGVPKLGASMRGYMSSISRVKVDDDVVYQYVDRRQQATAQSSDAADDTSTKSPKKNAKRA